LAVSIARIAAQTAPEPATSLSRSPIGSRQIAARRNPLHNPVTMKGLVHSPRRMLKHLMAKLTQQELRTTILFLI